MGCKKSFCFTFTSNTLVLPIDLSRPHFLCNVATVIIEDVRLESQEDLESSFSF